MVLENERATLLIDRGDVTIGVVSIASRLVRRIVSYVSEGEEIELGTRIGAIRFGSQVDVILPRRVDLEVKVETGDRIRAGESIIAVLPRQTLRIATANEGNTAARPQGVVRGT